MIVPRYYENLSVLHENTMPARAYYIPASKRMDNLVEHREESDRMQLLNGTWKFQYFNSIYDIQDSFFEKNYDTENFDEIQVPSVWQMAGYDTHQSIDFTALAESTGDSTLASLHRYMAARTPSRRNQYTGMFAGKNLILLTAESFSPWFISQELTPTLYRLTHEGFVFSNYYQPGWGQ